MGLSKFIVLKSDASNKLLCYAKGKGANHASLRFSQTESETKTDFHLVKFEVEEAKTAKGLVHIRTCYNNRYWVKKDANKKRIVAEANVPEEDQSKWNCTLFKPIILGTADDESNLGAITGEKPQKIQLVHISELKEHYVDENGSWLEGRSSASDANTLTAYNAEAMAILPEHMTFISFDNKFLSNFQGNDLGFVTTDVESPGVAMYTSTPTTTPQYIILRARDSNRPWRLNPNSNAAIGLVSSDTTDTRFGPILVNEGQHIALRVEATKNFVHRIDHVGLYQGVAARESEITPEALLRVGEPVRARQILSVDYNLEDATVYNTRIVDKFVDSRTNNSSVELTTVFQVEYTSTQTMSWNQSLTVHVGIPATWPSIPFVGESGIVGISDHRTHTSAWGEEKTEERTVNYMQSIALPPRKRATVTVQAVTSSCIVPFTSVVSDVMTDGSTREYTKTDCWFHGTNEYHFRTLILIEDA